MTAKIVLSGMQPSGILHIGNYIGGILNWKKMIAENPNFQFNFMVADLHSLTSLKDAIELRENIIDTAACYAACGIDFTADNISIFQQSKISEHAHLAWIFQTITPMGWLERMTQFKDKVRSANDEIYKIKQKIKWIEKECKEYFVSLFPKYAEISIFDIENIAGYDPISAIYYLYSDLLDNKDEFSDDDEYRDWIDYLITAMKNKIGKEKSVLILKEFWEYCKSRFEAYQALLKALKDEERAKTEKINTGLFTYPALMAADILLYDADFVPVGNDQKQHIELTRDIAEKFNRTYRCAGFFKQPEPITSEGARIMSLADGRKKMSKSDPSELSRILLTDSDDEIAKKISKAKTDSIREIYYDKENRPDISNLITIAACLSEKTIETVENECKNFNTKQFKDMLSMVLIEKISPIREKINEFRANDSMLKILADGNGYVKKIASKKIEKVNSLIGL
jgi:tryptophanyl-tRNA synthetase